MAYADIKTDNTSENIFHTISQLKSQEGTNIPMDTTKSKSPQLEAIFIPFPTAGHMNPMADIARLFSVNGVHVTIVITPLGIPTFNKTIDKELISNHKITLHILQLPSEESPLSEQSQPLSFSTIPNLVQFMKKLRPQIEQVVMERHPQCIVSDMFLPWTVDLAMSFGIPRFVFHGGSCFSLCCLHSTHYAPGKPQLMDSQFPSTHELTLLVNEVREADTRSHGALVNSFFELESSYFDHYTKSIGVKAWDIGPLHQSVECIQAERGTTQASAETHPWLDWLNNQIPNSVLYISFGSMTRLSTAQLVELAYGLEASEHPFMWALKQTEASPTENDLVLLLEGFMERMKETRKGLILKVWVPQLLILDHPATGGFLTHCGWNSIIESVTAGVPMVTWPIAADQFINEKLVTEVIKVGVKVGVEEQLDLKKALGYFVTREKVEKAVTRLMCTNEEAEDRRKRAEGLKKMAKKAVEKCGSSYGSIISLVDSLRAVQCWSL